MVVDALYASSGEDAVRNGILTVIAWALMILLILVVAGIAIGIILWLGYTLIHAFSEPVMGLVGLLAGGVVGVIVFAFGASILGASITGAVVFFVTLMGVVADSI